MNVDFLTRARRAVPNVPLLVNVISRRVRQLNAGQRPMSGLTIPTRAAGIALKEVAQASLPASPCKWVEDRRNINEDNDITSEPFRCPGRPGLRS
ncbi:MAG: DNA-directed RNA polymerase subunit omega [Kiritimatiellia bacterium]